MVITRNQQFVVCVDNKGYEAPLERRKIYVTAPQPEGPLLGLVRVIDESGEDYLYPEHLFRVIELPQGLGP
jgi:hypothetical protein